MKVLNIILIIIIYILIFVSIIALIAIHWNLSELEFDFSPDGLETYLNALGEYKSLFTGTVAVCASYFGLQRVKISTEANRERIKQDYFNEWKIVFQVRAAEVEKYNKRMIREFVKIRYTLYNDLYELNMTISNKEHLTKIFNKHIKSRVRFFEELNEEYIGMGECYPNNEYSYSYDAFRFIFLGMINQGYQELESDLKKLYLDNMNDDRTINIELFKISKQNFEQ